MRSGRDFPCCRFTPVRSLGCRKKDPSRRSSSSAGRLRWNLERDLAIDLLFFRHRRRLKAALEEFRPDLIHITGPGDTGILGLILAYDLRVPLVASWHTNLHEFGARRLDRFFRWLPRVLRNPMTGWAERRSLDECVRFYRLAKLILAPNPELVELLHRRTRRPAFLMQRGIDTNLFSPARRIRSNDEFVIGCVGRLSPEKNVRMLAGIERVLIDAGLTNYRFLIVGDGSERAWLEQNMHRADLPGILRGQALARAYASMDAFVFPSSTDTFGNVVLEAMASAVPAIVTPEGGPKFLVTDGANGYIASGAEEFAARILALRDPQRLAAMRAHARKSAERFSWDTVFGEVYQNYENCFAQATDTPPTASKPKDDRTPRLSKLASPLAVR